MGHDVTSETRFPQSLALMDEAKAIYGSYNKAAQAFGVPWSTVAQITSRRKPMPAALAAMIALRIGRDPLQAIAAVEIEAATPWQAEAWNRILTGAPDPDRGAEGSDVTPHWAHLNRHWRKGRKSAEGVSGMRGAAPFGWIPGGRIRWALRARYSITSASGWR